MANVHYEITLQDGGISPAAMSARLHETVQIHVTNQGSKSHNLVIKDFYIFTQDLKPSEDVSLSFAPDKKGTFQYYSDTGGKPEPGMRGQLRVQ
jgi:plastocyanin